MEQISLLHFILCILAVFLFLLLASMYVRIRCPCWNIEKIHWICNPMHAFLGVNPIEFSGTCCKEDILTKPGYVFLRSPVGLLRVRKAVHGLPGPQKCSLLPPPCVTSWEIDPLPPLATPLIGLWGCNPNQFRLVQLTQPPVPMVVWGDICAHLCAGLRPPWSGIEVQMTLLQHPQAKASNVWQPNWGLGLRCQCS